MKNLCKSALLVFVTTLVIVSCKKSSDDQAAPPDEISQEILAKIKAMGLSTQGVERVDGGYVAEGDIFLSNESLNGKYATQNYIIAEEEQYRTTNVVTGLPRVIKVSIDAGFHANFYSALDECIRRYNAEGLRLTFQRVTSGADIQIVGKRMRRGILGQSAGFPDASGNPAPSFALNTRPGEFGSNPNVNWVATVMAHEIGHAIGYRHTDYMNRSYSCGVGGNEGDGGVGAIHIAGTPTGPEQSSWMLACTDGTNRPFTNNDVVALRALYQ